MTYTTIEQSKALINLGLDEKTADLTITSNAITPYIHINGLKRCDKEYPCWSAEALLEMLPTTLYDENGCDSHSLIFQRNDSNNYLIEYALNYGDKVTSINDFSEEGELLNTLIKAILWLLKNKYL